MLINGWITLHNKEKLKEGWKRRGKQPILRVRSSAMGMILIVSVELNRRYLEIDSKRFRKGELIITVKEYVEPKAEN